MDEVDFNFRPDIRWLTDTEKDILFGIRSAVDARIAEAMEAKRVRFAELCEAGGHGQMAYNGGVVTVAVVRLNKTTLVVEGLDGRGRSFKLNDGREVGTDGFYRSPQPPPLTLTHVPPALLAKMEAVGEAVLGRGTQPKFPWLLTQIDAAKQRASKGDPA